MFEIEFYRLLGGKAPVEDFLNGLDKRRCTSSPFLKNSETGFASHTPSRSAADCLS